MKIRYLIILLAVAFASAGITYNVMKKNTSVGSNASAHEEHAEDVGGQKLEIAGLKIELAVAGEGWESVSVTGKVTVPPDRLVKISSRIGGKVVAAHGTVGDYVSRGQVLAVISSVELAEARAAYRQAAAKLSAARKYYERETQVAKLGAASMRPVEEARSDVLASQGEVADAKSELAQAKSEVTREESELAQCKARFERAKELYADKIVSRQDMETAEAEYKRDSASVDVAKSKVDQAQTRVEKAESKLEISKQYLTRETKVQKSRVVDLRSLQSAKAEVDSARIELQSASDKIRVLGASPSGSGDTIAVTSPISGRIVARNTNAGETVSSSDALFTVANLSRVWVEGDVYEKNLATVRKGQVVEIRVDAYPDRIFTGKVDSISDILSSESRTAKVRCVVSNSQGLLRGEMFARMNLLISKRGQTVLVAKEAVLDDAGSKIVYTPCMECPEDKKAGTNACGAYDKLTVKIGQMRGNKVEIISGLQPDTLVVTTGAFQIKTAMSSGKLEAGCTDH